MFCLDEYLWDINIDKKFKKGKKLKFNNIVKVYRIPNRNEILQNDLWWSCQDIANFKKTSYDEIINLIKRHQYMTVKQATKLLYQPGSMTITYDIDNFT
jgi:hypothetical protein